jgi:glucoamylase
VSDGRVFDRIDAIANRYLIPHAASTMEVLNLSYQPPRMKAGFRLRIPLGGDFRLRWTANNWATFADTDATPILNLWYVDILTVAAQAGSTLEFNIFWKDSQTWRIGDNFRVTLVP